MKKCCFNKKQRVYTVKNFSYYYYYYYYYYYCIIGSGSPEMQQTDRPYQRAHKRHIVQQNGPKQSSGSREMQVACPLIWRNAAALMNWKTMLSSFCLQSLNWMSLDVKLIL